MSHIGVNLGFGNLHEKLTDEQMYAGELRVAELAERLGFGGPVCRTDHRAKQSPGWHLEQAGARGWFRWTTTSDRSYLSRPARYPRLRTLAGVCSSPVADLAMSRWMDAELALRSGA